MHSLAKFYVECRFSFRNTVSASKRCTGKCTVSKCEIYNFLPKHKLKNTNFMWNVRLSLDNTFLPLVRCKDTGK